jgi:hypothetical protein
MHLWLDRRRGIPLLDNCPRETHDTVAALVKEPGSTLSLITVDLDIRDDRPEDTDAFRLQGASEGVIEALTAQRHPDLRWPWRSVSRTSPPETPAWPSWPPVD